MHGQSIHRRVFNRSPIKCGAIRWQIFTACATAAAALPPSEQKKLCFFLLDGLLRSFSIYLCTLYILSSSTNDHSLKVVVLQSLSRAEQALIPKTVRTSPHSYHTFFCCDYTWTFLQRVFIDGWRSDGHQSKLWPTKNLYAYMYFSIIRVVASHSEFIRLNHQVA